MEILVELIKVDVPDELTGFIYPRGIVQHAISLVEERISRNDGILGEELPAAEEVSEYINPAKASHVVKHMWIKGDTVMAKILLVGKYADMSKAGIQFDGFLRFFQHVGADNVTAEAMTIVTVDLLYRER